MLTRAAEQAGEKPVAVSRAGSAIQLFYKRDGAWLMLITLR